jgi:hypothetical protein
MARHRRHFSMNPLPPAREAVPLVGGVLAGGISTSYVANAVLGASDTGIIGYLANAVIWLGGTFALQKWANFAKGWFAGGALAIVGRAIDDATGKTVVAFNSPLGMSSYYSAAPYVLPDGSFLPAAAASPSALPMAASRQAAAMALRNNAGALPAAPPAAVAMGYNPRFGAA